MRSETLQTSVDGEADASAQEPRPARRRPPPLRVGLAAGVAGGVLLSVLLAVLTADVAPVVAVVLGVTVAAYAGRIGWRMSGAVVLLGALVGQTVFTWFTPHVGWSIGTDDLVAWTVIGVAHAAVLAVGPLPPLGRRRLVDLAAVVSAPAVVGGYVLLAARRAGDPWIAWGMGGDTANNVIYSRGLLEHGGLDRAQGIPDPLATALYAAVGAPQADDLSYAGLVRRLIVNGERLGLVLWALIGVVAAVIALSAIGVVAGLLPWTWFASGYGFAYGYQNAAPAVLVLMLTWVCWRGHAAHPVAALTGLILATWAAAMAWGPVAILPATWLLTAVVVDRAALRRAGRALLLPGLTFVAACTYAYLITLRDITKNSGALAWDGAHPNFDARHTVEVLALLLVLSVALARRAAPAVRLGLWAALPAGGLAVAFLIRARSGMPDGWGYYPIKYTWIAMIFVVLVAFGELLPLWAWLARRAWHGNGVLLAGTAAFAMMFTMSRPPPPVTVAGVLTPVALHDTTAQDAIAKRLLRVIAQHPKSIASRLSTAAEGGPASDAYMNFWMMQMGAASISDPIRNSAYSMDSTDPAAVCFAIASWGGGVTVWTRDPGLREELAKPCDPAYDYRVLVLPGGAG